VEKWEHYWILQIVSRMLDVFFFLNIIVSFRTAYWDNMELITDIRMIRRKYMALWFWVDLVSTIPWDVVLAVLDVASLTRLLRLLRLLRFSKVAFAATISAPVRLAKLAMYVVILGHILGCLWWDISDTGSKFGPPENLRTASFTTQYTLSLYWGLSALTGLGSSLGATNAVEGMLGIACTLVGTFVFAYIVGEVFYVLKSLNMAADRHTNIMTEVEAYIANRKIAHSTAQKMRRYCSAQIAETNGVNEQAILDLLPTSIRAEVSSSLIGSLLTSAPILSAMPRNFQDSLATHLRPEVFAKGDIITREGDVAEKMYFIRSGLVLVSKDSVPVSILKEGSNFGEAALLSQSVRISSVQALAHCTLYSLSMQDFNHIVAFNKDTDQVMQVVSFGTRNATLCRLISKTLKRLSNATLMHDMLRSWMHNRLVGPTLGNPLCDIPSKEDSAKQNPLAVPLRGLSPWPEQSSAGKLNKHLCLPALPPASSGEYASLEDATPTMMKYAAPPIKECQDTLEGPAELCNPIEAVPGQESARVHTGEHVHEMSRGDDGHEADENLLRELRSPSPEPPALLSRIPCPDVNHELSEQVTEVCCEDHDEHDVDEDLLKELRSPSPSSESHRLSPRIPGPGVIPRIPDTLTSLDDDIEAAAKSMGMHSC